MEQKIENIINLNKSLKSLKKEEKLKVKDILKSLLNEDFNIDKKVKNKENKLCFANSVDKDLCENNNTVLFSHVVAENQLKKLGSKIFKYREFLLDILDDKKVIETNSNDAGFSGFCNDCEKFFCENSLNIDNPETLTKKHMLKYLYRYFSKEIIGQELYIEKIKELNNKNNDLNWLLGVIGTNVEEEIRKHSRSKLFFKALFITLGNIVKKDIIFKNGSDCKNEDFYFLLKIEKFNNYKVVGQSLFPILSKTKEYELFSFIFCVFVIHNDNILLGIIIPNNIKKELKNIKFDFYFILLLSFLNNNSLYFDEKFKDEILPLINKYTKIDTTRQIEVVLSDVYNKSRLLKKDLEK